MDRGAWQATVLGVQRVGHNTQVKRSAPASEAFRTGQEVLPLFLSEP